MDALTQTKIAKQVYISVKKEELSLAFLRKLRAVCA